MEIVNWVCTIILNRGSDGPLLAHIACHVDLYRVDTSESVLVIVSQATQRHHLFMSHDQHETFHLVYCVVMVFVVFSHHQPYVSSWPSATTAWHLLSRLLIKSRSITPVVLCLTISLVGLFTCHCRWTLWSLIDCFIWRDSSGGHIVFSIDKWS